MLQARELTQEPQIKTAVTKTIRVNRVLGFPVLPSDILQAVAVIGGVYSIMIISIFLMLKVHNIIY